MEKRNRYYNYGSTAPSPSVHPDRRKEIEEKKKIQKERLRRRQLEIKEENRKKKKTMAFIGIVALFAFLTLNRSSELFTYQKQYNDLKVETREMEKEIAAAEAVILSSSGIDRIAEKAEALGMEKRTKENVIYVNLSRDNFSQEEPTIKTSQESTLQKLAKKLGLS